MIRAGMDSNRPCAYSLALAMESLDFRQKWDSTAKVYDGVTLEDLELFARVVGYKVACNLKHGGRMDPEFDPLNYVNCSDQQCL